MPADVGDLSEELAAARDAYINGFDGLHAVADRFGICRRRMERHSAAEGWVALRKMAKDQRIADEVAGASEKLKAWKPAQVGMTMEIGAAAAATAAREFRTVGGDAIAGAAATRSFLDCSRRIEEVQADVEADAGMTGMQIHVSQTPRKLLQSQAAQSTSTNKSSTQTHSGNGSNGHNGKVDASSSPYPRKGSSS